jgi:hypothetical protein
MGLLGIEDGSTKNLRNIEKCSSNDMASHSRRHECFLIITCLEMTCYWIKYSRVIMLLELPIGGGRMVYTQVGRLHPFYSP